MKAGILYPSSQAYPEADLDFVNGIKASLRNSGIDGAMTLLLESIGVGGTERDVYAKADKLLRFDEVDIVVAFVDYRVTPLLEPLFYAANKLLLVVNPGANHPMNWVAQPNIVYLTLGHAFQSWLTGAMAVEAGAVEAAIATTFYDCGYHHSAAMTRRFLETGGQPAFNFVSNQAYDERFEIGALTRFLSDNPHINTLLCTFDTRPAALFYRRLAEAFPARSLTLYVSPMMLEADALAGVPAGSCQLIRGCRSPRLTAGSAGAPAFQDSFIASGSPRADLFRLLGWEAGSVLAAIFDSGVPVNCDTILQQPGLRSMPSPRGCLELDPATNHYVSPVLECAFEGGRLHEQLLAPEPLREQWRAFSAYQSEGVSSGWMNTYLCY